MLELIQALFEGIWALLEGTFSLPKNFFGGILSLLEGIGSLLKNIVSLIVTLAIIAIAISVTVSGGWMVIPILLVIGIGSVSSKFQKQPQQYSSFDKTMKKIFAGLFLLAGLLIPVVTLATILDPYASPEEYEGMLAGFFILGLPCLVGGIWLTVGIIQQNQRETEEQQKAESDRLREIFFRLVRQENGEMTVLRFAMEAQIPGDQAKEYLNECAKQYDATFNVGDEGEISYKFHLHRNSGTPILSNQPKSNSQEKQPNHSFEFRFPIQFSNPIASKTEQQNQSTSSETDTNSQKEDQANKYPDLENAKQNLSNLFGKVSKMMK
jgi:hypothetical protein